MKLFVAPREKVRLSLGRQVFWANLCKASALAL
jgi:hypothetical protein